MIRGGVPTVNPYLKAFLRGIGFGILCAAFGYFVLGELLR